MPGDLVFLAFAIVTTIVGVIAVIQVPKYQDANWIFWAVLGLVVVSFWLGWARTLF